MANPMGEMIFMLPMIFLMNKIDFTDESNVFFVRIAYVVSQCLCFLAWGYIYKRISETGDKTRTIKVLKTPASPWGAPSTNPEDFEEQTVVAYDFAQAKKALNQLAMGFCIVAFLHYKWNLVQPLFLQSVMIPVGIYKNPLFKIYVLGQKGAIEERPFKEESPFAAMMQGAQQPAPAEAPPTEQTESETSTKVEKKKEK
eukprot:TRINITY_DN1222_c0_g1_i1.p1 TRINITY_DN1222_c0_g1~~TRINITY_DN1222_c0_g1_i1.p1  ORF type:complete len:199 (+),score=32.85 TRINITY_DN1222_c0_g1_i1:62-658(+)